MSIERVESVEIPMSNLQRDDYGTRKKEVVWHGHSTGAACVKTGHREGGTLRGWLKARLIRVKSLSIGS